jgi:hypothetical protein
MSDSFSLHVESFEVSELLVIFIYPLIDISYDRQLNSAYLLLVSQDNL